MTEKKTAIPDWSLLPKELLHIISTHLEDCFDVVHARSVCNSWRSTFPFPSYLLRPSYSLPAFADFPKESKDMCTLEKIPLFLFRVKTLPGAADESTCEYYLGGIGQDKSEDQMELLSPIQCSVEVNIPRTDPTLMNVNDCQIIPLGHQYRMVGWDPESWNTKYRGVTFIALNKERGEFVVLLNYYNFLLVLRSAEMRWMRVKETSTACCSDLVAFKGKFYASFLNGDISVYDPYTMIGTPLMPSQPLNLMSSSNLVRSGDDDELFLVELFNPYPHTCVLDLDFYQFACRVSILDEEAGKWVVVSDIGDRVLFIGNYDNVACSPKELPDCCGFSGNTILFTCMVTETYAYKYGVDTGDEDDDPTFWRFSEENCVSCVMTT